MKKQILILALLVSGIIPLNAAEKKGYFDFDSNDEELQRIARKLAIPKHTKSSQSSKDLFGNMSDEEDLFGSGSVLTPAMGKLTVKENLFEKGAQYPYHDTGKFYLGLIGNSLAANLIYIKTTLDKLKNDLDTLSRLTILTEIGNESFFQNNFSKMNGNIANSAAKIESLRINILSLPSAITDLEKNFSEILQAYLTIARHAPKNALCEAVTLSMQKNINNLFERIKALENGEYDK